jgi:steroid delta-isomerase-like uncharacterized protein
MSTAHPLEAVLARYNDAWNRHDVDAILAMHTDDSVFENHTSGGKAEGKDAIGAMLRGIFAQFPDLHFSARRAYYRDDLAVVEWTATATFDRPMNRGGAMLAPNGRKLAWNGMDIIPMRGDKVLRKDVYADSIGYLRQLGLAVP